MYNFHSGQELLKLTQKHRLPISEIVLRREIKLEDTSRKVLLDRMQKRIEVMNESIKRQIRYPRKSLSDLSGYATPHLKKMLKNPRSMILNKLVLKAMTYAIATGEHNAAMGRIVACPTAGSSGVIPGVVLAYAETQKIPRAKLIEAFFHTAGIGIIIAENATLAGAEGGCQAEIGAATAMAASALTELRGEKPEVCLNAAALALKNLLGLACDPVSGLVEVPCVKRSGLAAVHSIAASDLAVAGIESFIPFDEVVSAMSNIGKLLSPKLRETALGGLAITQTAQKIDRKLGFNKENFSL